MKNIRIRNTIFSKRKRKLTISMKYNKFLLFTRNNKRSPVKKHCLRQTPLTILEDRYLHFLMVFIVKFEVMVTYIDSVNRGLES
jgi:hypothetical protein